MAITVKVFYGRGVHHDIRMNENAPVRQLLPDLVETLNLPPGDEYYLVYRGRRLDGDDTLSSAGARNGDELLLNVEYPDRATPSAPRLGLEQLVALISGMTLGMIHYSRAQEKDLRSTLDLFPRCPMTNSSCNVKIQVNPYRALVIMPSRPEYTNLYKGVIKPTLELASFEPVRVEERIEAGMSLCNTCRAIRESSLNIVDVSDQDHTVSLVLGLIFGIGHDVVLIRKQDANLPFLLSGLACVSYGSYDPDFPTNLLIAIWQKTGARLLRDRQCPICGKTFTNEDVIFICLQDQIPHHKTCWQKQKQCAKCSSREYIEVQSVF